MTKPLLGGFVKSFLHFPQTNTCQQITDRFSTLWPRLLNLYKKNFIPEIALYLSSEFSADKEEVALLVCHLFLASTYGHACIRCLPHSLDPSIQSTWINSEGETLPLNEALEIEKKILEGAKTIKHLLSEKENFSALKKSEIEKLLPICITDDHYYFHKFWQYETTLITKLKDHFSKPVKSLIDKQRLQQFLQQMSDRALLTEEQAKAVLSACTSSFTIITGGPGTGKTYTAALIVQALQECRLETKEVPHIVLTAPTGKATSNLRETILNQLPKNITSSISAQTIHALLQPFKKDFSYSATTIKADFMIIDECSMIDTKLMADLLIRIQPGTPLVLIGDKNQLQAIEPGSPFYDLQKIDNPPFGVTSFNKTLRTKENELILCSHMIREGKSDLFLDHLSKGNYTADQAVTRRNLSPQPFVAEEQIISHLASLMCSKSYQNQKEVSQSLTDLTRVRSLTGCREGVMGVERMNRFLYEEAKKSCPEGQWLAVPILIAKNDYEQDLFNGELGVIASRGSSRWSGEEVAFFPPRSPLEPVRQFLRAALPPHELAYCLSVNKSQGSAFDHVVLLLPSTSRLFGRELLYTAVTRAKQKIEICGDDETIKHLMSRQQNRLSSFVQQMNLALEGSRC